MAQAGGVQGPQHGLWLRFCWLGLRKQRHGTGREQRILGDAPIFEHYPPEMFTDTIATNMQSKILAKGIPALSRATGARSFASQGIWDVPSPLIWMSRQQAIILA